MKWLENIKGSKKEQILILLLSGILLLVIVLPTDPPSAKPLPESEAEAVLEGAKDRTEQLEEKLQRILGQVEGIGKTEVMITLKSDGRQVVEKDVERQESREGQAENESSMPAGQKSSSEQTVYQKDSRGNEVPYVTETVAPEITGVLVIAQGGGNAVIANEITEAVMALFGVEAHKIKVMKME